MFDFPQTPSHKRLEHLFSQAVLTLYLTGPRWVRRRSEVHQL